MKRDFILWIFCLHNQRRHLLIARYSLSRMGFISSSFKISPLGVNNSSVLRFSIIWYPGLQLLILRMNNRIPLMRPACLISSWTALEHDVLNKHTILSSGRIFRQYQRIKCSANNFNLFLKNRKLNGLNLGARALPWDSWSATWWLDNCLHGRKALEGPSFWFHFIHQFLKLLCRCIRWIDISDTWYKR